MIQAKCIQKFRDKNNHIYGYRLQDLNGQTQDVQPNNLKQAIVSEQIHVANLTLTKDGRLVDTTEHHLQDKNLGLAPQKPVDKEEIFFDKLYEIEKRFCDVIGGDAGCCADSDKRYGISYMDQILGAYYPDEYHGDPDDCDQCYGVTVHLKYSNDGHDIWIAWQGDNGMASEEFAESAELIKPLYTDRNIEIISKTMDKFITRVQKWIYNDENGIEQEADFLRQLGKDKAIKLREEFIKAVKDGKYSKKSNYDISDLRTFAEQIGMIKMHKNDTKY